MGRLVKNWIDSYLEYTSELEAPDYFHRWTAFSVLASAVRRNVWINQGHYSLFPNMYVILTGPQGKVGKSTVIRAGRKILFAAPDIVIGRDAMTREDLIVTMSGIGAPGKVSAIALYSTELSSLIEKSQEGMIAFLTDIYDCEHNPKGWTEGTKTQGKFAIHNPVVNILAGTTPKYLGDSLPVSATESGFTARTIFVYAEEPRFLNPRPKEPSERIVYELSEDIKEISTLKGPMTMSNEAWALYESMYEQVGKSDPPDYRLAGYYWRKAKVHLLKAAMLINISHSDSLVIEAKDLQKAWDTLAEVEGPMAKAFSSVGKNPYASDIDRIQNQILTSEGGIDKNRLIAENYSVANQEVLNDILETILTSGRAKVVRRDGKDVVIPVWERGEEAK